MLQKRPLVDAVKMDELLQLLRTNEFIGTIDPKHHSYLSEELLQIRQEVYGQPGGASTIVCISPKNPHFRWQ
jgi:hypothetical protein